VQVRQLVQLENKVFKVKLDRKVKLDHKVFNVKLKKQGDKGDLLITFVTFLR